MKRLGLIGGLMVLLLGACTSHSETRQGTSLPHASLPELAAIDSLMWRQPDSALAVLQQFAASPKADSLDEFNEHYCQLLISELLYKNDYGQSNRPALQQTVRYFDSLCLCKGVARNISTIAFLDARAHYINGVGYYERDSAVEACKEYLKALEVMEGHFEKDELIGHRARFMAYTYNRLGDMFSAQFMMEPAINCYEDALYFCKIESTSPQGVSNILYRLGKQYDKMGEKTKASDYYEQAIHGLPNNNSLLFRDLVSTKALCDYQLGRGYEQSLNTIKQIQTQANSEIEYLFRSLTIGGIFFKKMMYDSALFYLVPVYEYKENVTIQIQAADYLRIIYDSLDNEEKSDESVRFLANHVKTESQNKALVSQLGNLFQNYLNWKMEKRAIKEKKEAVLRTVIILVLIVLVVVLAVIVAIRKKSKKNMAKLEAEAQKEMEKRVKQHEKVLQAEQQAHRMEQAALSGRLKRSNEELRELKDQIRQQTDNMNPKQETQALSFNDEPICRLIMERVNEGQFKAQMDCMNYKDYALGKDDLVALREAANRHFNQFTIRLAKAYPTLTQGDLDYCCLYLLGLSDADISALMQRAYNTVNERNSKLRRVFGSENAISFTLQAIANESVSI